MCDKILPGPGSFLRGPCEPILTEHTPSPLCCGAKTKARVCSFTTHPSLVDGKEKQCGDGGGGAAGDGGGASDGGVSW